MLGRVTTPATPAPDAPGRTIVLVRHAQAYNTAEPDGARPVDDPSNPPLTPLGEQQARAAGAALSGFVPDAVVASPFLRTAQTAEILTAPLTPAPTVRLDARFCEYFVFEPLRGFRGVDPALYRRVLGDRVEITDAVTRRSSYPTFPEERGHLVARVRDLLGAWLATPGWDRLLLVGHGASVTAAVGLLVPGRPVGESLHTAITELDEVAPTATGHDLGSWRPRRFFDTAHLGASATGRVLDASQGPDVP